MRGFLQWTYALLHHHVTSRSLRNRYLLHAEWIFNLSWEQRSVFAPHVDSGVPLPEPHIKQLSAFHLQEQCNSFLLHLTNQGQSTILMGFVVEVKSEGERKKFP